LPRPLTLVAFLVAVGGLGPSRSLSVPRPSAGESLRGGGLRVGWPGPGPQGLRRPRS